MAGSSSQGNQTPAVNVSHRAHKVAEMIDRLWPGTYHLIIIKNEIESVDWSVEIVRGELVKKVSLSNKTYASE